MSPEPITHLPIGQLLQARAAEFPTREALSIDGVGYSYEVLNGRANRLANAMLGLGIVPGCNVASMSPTSTESIDVWFGLAKAGIVQAPINVELRGLLLAQSLRTAAGSALIIDQRYLERVAAIAGQLDQLEHIIVVCTGDAIPPAIEGITVTALDSLLADSSAEPPDMEVQLDDVESIIFTSGTTGPSKGALRTHRANLAYAWSCVDALEYSDEDAVGCAFPLTHSFARYNAVLPMLIVGGRTVLLSKFSASTFWKTCQAAGVTSFNFVGATLRMLLDQPPQEGDAAGTIRKGFGVPLPPEIQRAFETRFGVRLVEPYGSTEAGIVATNSLSDSRPGSCGRPVPLYELEIHDAEDRPVPTGERGEIVVRPRQPGIMFSGYYGLPTDTLSAIRNLWFHTGDLGVLDDDGWLTFVDRAKDSIRRRGENISAWEIEQVALLHPAVEEAAAIGLPSELTEEDVALIVVVKHQAALEYEQLIAHCSAHLPPYAVPRYVRVIDDLPKTSTGRVQKGDLRASGLTEDTWDRMASNAVSRQSTVAKP